MSAEDVGWVYRHSPARGAAFVVHLAIADSTNDQHEHEFWLRLSQLAVKARVNRGTAQRAISWLIENGLLDVLDDDRQSSGRAVRYRFLTPELDVVYESRTSRTVREGADSTSRTVREGVAHTARGGRAERATLSNPSEPKTNAKKDSAASDDAAALAKATDDPLHRKAHELAVLAFEQPVKPVLRSNGDGFVAVYKMIASLLHAGHAVNNIEAAIRAGVEVWTLAGLQTSIAQQRQRRRDTGVSSVLDLIESSFSDESETSS